MKKIFGLLAALILLVTTTFTMNEVRAEVNSSPLDSPESYIKYLENYSIQNAYNVGVSKESAKSSVDHAKVLLEQFKSLSKKEQEQFISIFSDIDLVKAIYSGDYEKLPEDVRDKVYWTEEEEIIENPVKNPIGVTASSHTIQHTGKLSALGLTLVGYKIVGKYEYNSKGATKALSTKADVEFNYNPSVETGLQYYNGYISNGYYYGESSFYYKIGIQGVGGVQIGNCYLDIKGDERGKISGSFYRS